MDSEVDVYFEPMDLFDSIRQEYPEIIRTNDARRCKGKANIYSENLNRSIVFPAFGLITTSEGLGITAESDDVWA